MGNHSTFILGEQAEVSDPEADFAPLAREASEELVGLFEEWSRSLRLPPSLGRIYGLLFGSQRPLSFDEIGERLALSKGAVSQGLQSLQELKAVRPIKIDGDRRTYFEPETSLRRLTRQFLEDIILPHLDDGQERIDRLADRLDASSDEDLEFLRGQVDSLRNWQRKLRKLLPWLGRLAAPGQREDSRD